MALLRVQVPFLEDRWSIKLKSRLITRLWYWQTFVGVMRYRHFCAGLTMVRFETSSGDAATGTRSTDRQYQQYPFARIVPFLVRSLLISYLFSVVFV